MLQNIKLAKGWCRFLPPRARAYTSLMLSVAVGLLLVACAKLATTHQFRCDDQRIDRASAIPADIARRIIAKHADAAWVDDPYLSSTVTVEKKHPDSGYIKEIQKERERIHYNEMIVYPDHAGRCVLIRVSQMEGYKNPSHQPFLKGSHHYFLTPRRLCPRTKAEMDELIDAFLTLGARC